MEKPSNFIPKGMFKFVHGSATIPEASGLKYILQIVNNHGIYHGDFSKAIDKRWPSVGTQYKNLYRSVMSKMTMGNIQSIQVQSDIVVCNMVAAHGTEPDENDLPPIRYDALERCLSAVGKEISNTPGSVHIPKFGSNDETGSDWSIVETLITEQLLKRGINVTVYTRPEEV